MRSEDFGEQEDFPTTMTRPVSLIAADL